MDLRRRLAFLGALLALSLAAPATQGAALYAVKAEDPLLVPHRRPGGKWRVAYVETKPFVNYAATLANLVLELKGLGWLSNVDGLPYQDGQTDAKVIWDWLAARDLGPYIEMKADAFYTFDGLKGPEINKAAEPILKRLAEAKDIDLVLAMGTEPGKTMASDVHKVPVLVFSTSNAVKAGIAKSVTDSGRDHVWAHMDPLRYRRQIEIFHDIFHFKKLGVVYENSKSGRTFGAVDDVEAVARERGFQIVREFVAQPQPDKTEEFYRDLLAATRKVSASVDAFYFGLFIGIDAARMPEMLAPFTEKKIPVFAQQAPDDVRYGGALMSVARANFKGVGRFGAETIAKVLNGVQPRKLNQVFENSPNIILNLQVARAIGYKPSFDILLVADEVYQTVERKN